MPVKSSMHEMPSDHTSHLGEWGSCLEISGAMYSGVPMYCATDFLSLSSSASLLRRTLERMRVR